MNGICREARFGETPLISVVTVSYNHAEFIKKNIESVLAQNYPNIEHIIVDGASTDHTVDILKSYSHLDWVSEPDRGQTHALNKGFQKAKGDILCWLNSDDWLAEGAFEAVVAALRDSPIVMGSCAVVDKEGKTIDLDENRERSWYDLLKYWIYHFSPSQPSVFFRRDLLEAVREPDGTYLDEELHYCMDLDLWLRMAEWAPLNKRVDRVLSYFPKYDESKTGGDWEPIYREMAGVYRRYELRHCHARKKFCCIVPDDGQNRDLGATLNSIVSQALVDVDVLVVDYARTEADSNRLNDLVRSAEEQFKIIGLRYLRAKEPHYLKAFQEGLLKAKAPYVLLIQSGATLKPDFFLQASNLMQHDLFGAALPLGNCPELKDALSVEIQGMRIFQAEKAFSTGFIQPTLLGRRVALMELVESGLSSNPLLMMKEMLVRLAYKGWQINLENSLEVHRPQELWAWEEAHDSLFRNYVNASIIDRLDRERKNDPFGEVRTRHGFSFELPEMLADASRRLLSLAPQDWMEHDWSSSNGGIAKGTLQSMTGDFPDFAPAWKVLLDICSAQSDSLGQQEAQSGFERARQREASF